MKCLLVLIMSLGLCFATISPGDKSKSQQKVLKAKNKKGPVDESVYERKLIDTDPSPQEILVEHAAYCKHVDQRNFNGTVLGYVTPVS